MRRREWLKSVPLAAATPALAARPLGAAQRSSLFGVASRTAIQGVCAWPNLQRLRDSSLVTMIFNQPCHGLWEGDLDCWGSEDEGKTWRFRGRIAEHEPTTNRMNCSAGIAHNGDVLVLCSGWADRSPKGQRSGPHRRVLRSWVCRSSDGGLTWSVNREFPVPPDAGIGRDNQFIPFGNIRIADDGSLCAAVHLVRGNARESHLLRSRDDGDTWGERVPLNPGGNETDILHLGGGRWLAASREFRRKRDVHVELFSSDDDAAYLEAPDAAYPPDAGDR